ncbi:hypothetical protein G4D82_12585 [Flavobacterium sp. CYK-4]|uniref:fibronectin type III domain-containing protein n=1 Tax=Flavobacterium lotistagni TaxID=2709660 RepID=UPI00140B4DA0|nr:fibronectin type III domain-containing protein [Flavobacterium lotistagni]NHM08061.1 hypothetical protein [Flavobacterium lotistagni]
MKKIYCIFIIMLARNLFGQTVPVFSPNSPWKYQYDQYDLAVAWRALNFDDSNWQEASGEIGFGDGDEIELIAHGSGQIKHRTTYFRKKFQITNGAAYQWFRLSILRDDAAVVYLNGVEVARSNMPNNQPIAYSDIAARETKNGDEATFFGFNISPDLFREGENLLAIEVHQFKIDDEDLSFNAKLDAVPFSNCEPPTGILSSNITTTSATISWDAISAASGYQVRYRPALTGIWTITATTNPLLNLSNLSPATSYEFEIQPVCNQGNFSARTFFTTQIAYCDTPTTLTASNVTASTATLSWAATEGANNYTLQYRRTGTSQWTTENLTGNTKTLSGLLESSLYEFQVQASCLIPSAMSAPVHFMTLASGTNFIIPAGAAWKYLDNGSNQGTTWRENNFNDSSWPTANAKFGYGEGDETTLVNYGPDANNKYVTTYFRRSFQVSNPAAYSAMLFEVMRDDGVAVYLNGTEIFRNNLPEGTINYNTFAMNSVGGSDETQWYSILIDSNNLLVGTNVIAVEIHQQSLASSDLTFNGRLSGTIPSSCGIPDNLNTAGVDSSSATINWQAVAGATGYYIQYRIVGTATWTSTATNTNAKLLSGLVPDTDYEYQVQALCSIAGDFSALGQFSTVAMSCAIPTGLSTSNVTGTTAQLSWQAVPDAENYNVQYRQVDTEEWNTGVSTTTTINIIGLNPQTAYEFKVMAICSLPGGFSDTTNFITTNPVCHAPTALTVVSNTASTVYLNWNAVVDASAYNIQYQLAGSNTWVNTTSSTNTKAITGLIPSTNYQFRVQAVCSYNSDFSTIVDFTTYPGGTDTFLPANATWKYLDNGSDAGTTWRNNNFDDSSWLSGKAEFGYGDGDETTVVSYGPDANHKHLTTYFRKTFNVINPNAYSELTLGVIFDDGVVVYLNGTEVMRRNMPAGNVNYNMPANASVSGSAETTWNNVVLSPSMFLTGTNVLTAEVHQASYDSSDMSFNARITAPSTEVIPVVTRGAYLQKVSSESITIRWRTDIACDSKVQFGTSIAYGNHVSDEAFTTEHEITLNGLTPGTKYFYSIGTETQTLQGDLKNNFITAPVEGSTTPVRIWAIGDFGTGTNSQLNVRNAYTAYTGNTPTNLWLWLGDNAYTTGTDTDFQDRTFNQYQDQFKSMPLFTTPGNHDYNETGYQKPSTLSTNYPYFSIFSLPENGECGGVPSGSPKYYSFNYANIHFISIDSYGTLNAPGTAMHNWLINDLQANTQRWTVVFMHYPPYTYGTHNSDTETTLIDMRTILVPLLESYHVDLLLAGHSHVNERSYMVHGHYDVATTFNESMKVGGGPNNFVKNPPYEGTVYAVCGTSGQNPEVVNQPGYPMPMMYFNNNTNNCSLVIDVNGDVLTCKSLASTGAVVDDFTITKN